MRYYFKIRHNNKPLKCYGTVFIPSKFIHLCYLRTFDVLHRIYILYYIANFIDNLSKTYSPFTNYYYTIALNIDFETESVLVLNNFLQSI